MTVKLPDDLIKKLSSLEERTDKVCEKMLKAGGEVVEAAVKSKLASAIGHGTKYPSRSTGQLLSALGTSPMKLGRDGILDVKIGFAENRGDGEVNAKLASVLEYGKAGQPGKPFIRPAKTSARSGAIAAMTAVFDSEMKNL
jgi:HK97 gp10 family phage protein